MVGPQSALHLLGLTASMNFDPGELVESAVQVFNAFYVFRLAPRQEDQQL
jgi:hypothetical protein